MIAAPVLSNDRPDLPARCYLERAIVANLIVHLQSRGFEPHKVDDGGDERIQTPDLKGAMEAIFAVDESTFFVRNGDKKLRAIVIVLGNGEDCICDHSVSEADGFSKAMDDFDADVLPGIVSGEGLHKALAEAHDALRGMLQAWEEQFGPGACDCMPEPQNAGHVCHACKARLALGV